MGGSRDAYFLKTSRLGFRTWTENDLPLALSLWANPQVTRFIGGPFSAEAVRHRLASEIACASVHGVQYWPIFQLSNGEFVGAGGLRPYKPAEHIYELGIHLLPEQWGQGLAQEAARGIIEFAFTTVGAKSLFAGHHPENAASKRLLEKLGFAFTHRELYAPTGLEHPSYLLMAPAKSQSAK